MDHGGNQGGAPVPRPVRRLVTAEDMLQAYPQGNQNDGAVRKGFPLPKKAPEFEGTVWEFDKTKDDTGDDLGNLLKRGVYHTNNYIGDTRRLILHLLPVTNQTRKQFGKLAVELITLEEKLAKQISELNQTIGIDMQKQAYFNNFPALKD